MIDVLGFLVFSESGGPEFAAHAGLAEAAPLRLRKIRVEVVDPDGAVPQARSDALALAGVLRPDRSREAVGGVVAELHRLVLAVEGLNGDHRSEGFIDEYRRAARHLVQHGGCVVEALLEFPLAPGAATAQACTLVEAFPDVGGHLVAVGRRNEGARFGVLVKRSAETDLAGASDQLVDEPLGDGFLDEEPGTGGAHLTGMDEGGIERVVEGGVEIGVGEDDVRVLATQLQRHLLDGARRRRGDPLAGLQAAREGHHVDVGVLGQGRAHDGAGTQHEVGDALGKAQGIEEVHHQDGRVRSQFAGFQDEGAPRTECRRNLPGGLQEGIVPRGDEPAHPHGFVGDPAHHAVVAGIDHAPGVLAGQLAEVGEAVGDIVYVDLALDQALAGVQRLGPGELVLAGAQLGRHPEEEVTAMRCGHRSPLAGIEGLPGCRNGTLGVFPSALGHIAHGFAVGRAVDGAGTAVGSRHPFPANEQCCCTHLVSSWCGKSDAQLSLAL